LEITQDKRTGVIPIHLAVCFVDVARFFFFFFFFFFFSDKKKSLNEIKGKNTDTLVEGEPRTWTDTQTILQQFDVIFFFLMHSQ